MVQKRDNKSGALIFKKNKNEINLKKRVDRLEEKVEKLEKLIKEK